MKKTIYSLMLALALGLGLVACDEEKALPPMILPEGGLGTGAWNSPLSVVQVREGSAGTAVWVKGYIVGWIDTSNSNALSEETAKFTTPATTSSNLLLATAPDCTDYTLCIPVQLPVGDIRTALSPANAPDVLGKEVCIKGDCQKYFGTAGLKNPTAYNWGSLGIEEAASENPGGEGEALPEGTGTLEAPYNASQVLAIASQLPADQATSEQYYITGYVTKVKSIDTGQYGNAEFYIADRKGGSPEFYVFRVYGKDGNKITDADIVKVGDQVVVKAALVNYKGNTPETKQGGSIISVNGQTL